MYRTRITPENWRAQDRGSHGLLRIPDATDDDGWHRYQDAMWSAYMMEGYSEEEMAALQLFLAYDEGSTSDDPTTIGETVPVVGDVPLMVNVGVSIVSGGILGLDHPESDGPDIARAGKIWKRSKWQSRKRDVVTQALSMGEAFIEAQYLDREGRVVLVPHDPRCVDVEYDPAGLYITKAVITIHEERRGDTVIDSIKRILTPTRILVEQNGERIASKSGPNVLGVVPLVHIVPMSVPGSDPRHGVSVAHALRVAKAQVDSAFAQANAIGSRQGNPILALLGTRLADGADNPQQLGRILNIPVGADVKYLTSDPAAIGACLERAKIMRQAYIQSEPEFYFAGMTAGESGEARRIKAGALQMKYEDIRSEIYAQITEITAMAVAMEARRPFREEDNRFKVLAGPILSPEMDLVVKHAMDLRKANLITVADGVRQLQRINIVDPEADPDEYARLLEDNTANAASLFFGGPQDPMRHKKPMDALEHTEETEDDPSEMPEEDDPSEETSDIGNKSPKGSVPNVLDQMTRGLENLGAEVKFGVTLPEGVLGMTTYDERRIDIAPAEEPQEAAVLAHEAGHWLAYLLTGGSQPEAALDRERLAYDIGDLLLERMGAPEDLRDLFKSLHPQEVSEDEAVTHKGIEDAVDMLLGMTRADMMRCDYLTADEREDREQSAEKGPGKAPRKGRNDPGSASGKRGGIQFSPALEKAISARVKAHNVKVGGAASQRLTQSVAEAVVRRGMGAWLSSRRKGAGQVQWGLGRLAAFERLLRVGRPEDPDYVNDNDLLPKGHPRARKA